MDSSENDFYEILGVEKNASDEEIHAAYRKKAMKNHPDVGPEDEREERSKRFKQISIAYDSLRDERSRAFYDHTGHGRKSLLEEIHQTLAMVVREAFLQYDEEPICFMRGKFTDAQQDYRDQLDRARRTKAKIESRIADIERLNDLENEETRGKVQFFQAQLGKLAGEQSATILFLEDRIQLGEGLLRFLEGIKAGGGANRSHGLFEVGKFDLNEFLSQRDRPMWR